jgi:hypothetical protein
MPPAPPPPPPTPASLTAPPPAPPAITKYSIVIGDFDVNPNPLADDAPKVIFKGIYYPI